MKTIIFLFVALTASFVSYSQKAKSNLPPADFNRINAYSCPMHCAESGCIPGTCTKCGMMLVLSTKEQMKTSVMNNFTRTIHLSGMNVKAGNYGKCEKAPATVAASCCSIRSEITCDKSAECSECAAVLKLSKKEAMKLAVTNTSQCAMHLSTASASPGKCVVCGMELIPTQP